MFTIRLIEQHNGETIERNYLCSHYRKNCVSNAIECYGFQGGDSDFEVFVVEGDRYEAIVFNPDGKIIDRILSPVTAGGGSSPDYGQLYANSGGEAS